MNKLIWIILAFLSGAFLPIQAGLNARLGKAAESPVYASLISFVVGTVALLLYVLLTRQSFSWEGLKTAPWQVWMGGILGAFYITVVILAFPHLGPGLTFGLIVAGQMIISALMEHFNVLVAQSAPLNVPRLLGIAFVIIGVLLLRKF